MERRSAVVLLVVAMLLVAAVSWALWSANWTIQNDAAVHSTGLLVCSDEACTQNLTSIDWGMIAPGETKTVPAFVRNLSDESGVLHLTTTAWNPTAAELYIVGNWTVEGFELPSNQTVRTDLILTVSPEITGINAFTYLTKVTLIQAQC